MKYKVTAETAISIQGKRYEPGQEVLTAPVHARPFLEAGQLEAVAIASKPRKASKPANQPTDSTETVNNG